MSISVQNLTKTYGTQRAIDSLNFTINSGEIVGFLGPNGAGKSTTMKILTGYLLPSEGSAFVEEMNVAERPIDIKKSIGYLPENNPLYTDMYVREFLEFMGSLHGMAGLQLKARVEVIIDLVGLTVEQRKKIGQLSKGYRQRVGLAHALIHDPEVLILDEPTTGLDPNQLVEIRQLIKTIGKEKTVILSTHIMQEVEALCDRVIIIDRGKIVADRMVNAIKQEGKSVEAVFRELTS